MKDSNFSGSDIELYKDAMTYDTFDMLSMNKALEEIKTDSFNYLYNAQRDLINYSRFNFSMKNLHRTRVGKQGDGSEKWMVYLDSNFIAEKQRRTFKNSQFNRKELSVFDISSNPKLFVRSFLPFVDGKFYDSLRIYCDEDKTYLIFKVVNDGVSGGVPRSHFNELLQNDAKITVFFIPNCSYGSYSTNRNVLMKYKDNLALDRFNIINNLDTETKYITFVNTNDLLFSSVITDTVNSSDMLRFTNENINDFKNRLTHLNIFGLRNLYDQIDLSGGITGIEKKPKDLILAMNNIAYSESFKATTSNGQGLKISVRNDVGVYNVKNLVTSHSNSMAVAFSSDNKYFAYGYNDNSGTIVELFEIINNVFTSMGKYTFNSGSIIKYLSFSKNNDIAVGMSNSMDVSLFRSINNIPMVNAPITINNGSKVSGITFVMDGNQLVIAHSENDIVVSYDVSDTTTPSSIFDIEPMGGSATCITSNNDGSLLAIGTSDTPYIYLYEFDSKDNIFRLNLNITKPMLPVKDVSFSSNALAIIYDGVDYMSIYEKTKNGDNTYFMRVNSIVSGLTSVGSICEFSPNSNELSIVYSDGEQVFHILQDSIFSIPKQDMPVPVENVMIFRNKDGHKVFAHDIKLRMYYPNYYEVLNNDENDDLSIYVFYFNDTPISEGEPDYIDKLDLFKKVFTSFNKSNYLDDAVPDLIRGHIENDFIFDLKDYKDSNSYPNHLEYRVKKLKEWIKGDPTLLIYYLMIQMDKTKSFYLECTPQDLLPRLRLNNFNEVEYEDEKRTFDEERYLFVLRRYYVGSSLYYRFFIDGNNYFPDEVYSDDFYEYYYIPKSLVKDDSIIEVEKFDTFEHNKTVRFTSSNKIVNVSFPRPIPDLNPSFIFLVKNGTNDFIDRSNYRISFTTNNQLITLKPDSFVKLPQSFNIEILDDTLVEIDITVHAKEYYYINKYDIKEADDAIKTYSFNANSENDASRVRIFKNGRLLPPGTALINFSAQYAGENFIAPKVPRDINDVMVIDYTPYKYSIIAEYKTIPSNGLLDLKGKIDKPFDLRWFDVYINGRKLNKNNIDVITPTIIFVKNVESTKNLVIYQKNRGEEYFGFDSINDLSFNDKLWNLVESFKEELLKRDNLDDLEADIIADIIDTIDLEKGFFYDQFMKYHTFINPDQWQIRDNVKLSYPSIFTNNIMFIDPDADNPDASAKLKIFPNHEF